MACGIVVLLGILQISLIKPYYRSRKIKDARLLVKDLANHLFPLFNENEMQLVNRVVENNACILVKNNKGKTIYFKDSVGLGCLLKEPYNKNVKQFLTKDVDKESSITLKNELTKQDMLVYAFKAESNLETNYIYVSTALEPVDSLLFFFMRQYLWYTVIVLTGASIVAIIVTKTISKPIVEMKDEAKKLSKVRSNIHFNGGGIQEIEELAIALNQSAKKLSKMDEMRRDLLANVSHDIRTPITNIQAYTEMLQDFSANDPLKREKHLAIIMKEAKYMNHLVSDMSDLAQMEAGHMKLQFTNVDMVVKIEDILSLYQPQIIAKQLKIKKNMPNSLTIYADDIKMGQVISNYLSNAIKHSPLAGTILINMWRLADEETMHLEICDQGKGIAKKDQETIWNRYQKASSTFSRSCTSTGLGLAIVKAILDAHGAKYGVISDVGRGSIFYMEYHDEH